MNNSRVGRLAIVCAICIVLSGYSTHFALAVVFSDSFEDGAFDGNTWVTIGQKGGYAGVGTGSWNYSFDEVTSSDGYLQARVWGPTSGNTYGAEAWVRTKYDFNDGNHWLINFSWGTAVGYAPHFDGFVVDITDGTIPQDAYFDWFTVTAPWLPRYDSRLNASHRLWRSSLRVGGIDEPYSPPFDKETWSMVIDPSGSATLYQSPDGQGTPYQSAVLNLSQAWHFRLYLNDATSAGFSQGDNALRLYDFLATPVPEPISLSLLALGGLAVMLRKRR